MPKPKILLLILVLAFSFRLLAAWQWQNQADQENQLFRLGDSHSYWTLATRLANGESYQYGSENAKVFRAPLFPMLLTPLTLISPPEQAVFASRVVGCLFGTFAVYMIMVIASRLGGTCASIAAGTVAACYPAALGMSFLVLSEMLFIPLMLLHLSCWQLAWNAEKSSKTIKHSVWAGVFAGLAILTRPSWLLFTPFSILVGLAVGKDRGRHFTIGCISLLAISVTMTPWWVRNYSVTGRFVPSTLQVGPSLYDGLHEGANGASEDGMKFMKDLLAKQLELDEQASAPLASTLEFRLNQLATQEAVAWALQNPQKVAWLAFEKFKRTWSLWPNGGETSSFAMRLLLSLGCFGTLTLAMLATVRAVERNWIASICWLPCLYFTLLHMVFVGSIRYREPAVFLLSTLAGCGLAWLAGCKLSSKLSQANGRSTIG